MYFEIHENNYCIHAMVTINSNTWTDQIKETHAEDFDSAPAHHVRGNTYLTLRYYKER
jgi:hypothetical protein